MLRKGKLFSEKPYLWEDAQKILDKSKTQNFSHLLPRVEPKKVAQMLEASKDLHEKNKQTQKPEAKDSSPKSPEIGIEDFMKVDLRVALVKEASDVEGAKKLLKLRLSLGDDFPERTVCGNKICLQSRTTFREVCCRGG